MIEWLLSPVDPSRLHQVGPLVSWHGRLMVLAWAVIVPAGIIAARYFKVTPRQDWPRVLDNRAWWVAHRGLQYSAGLVLLAAALLVLWPGTTARSTTPTLWLHRLFGITVIALALVQFLSAWLRGTKGGPTSPALDGSLRGDHFDMTPRRRRFEWVHKFGGIVALAVSVAAILTGLWQANGPVWMWLCLLGWWGGLAGVVVLCERRSGALDTYQAIWGNDPALPGNRIKPIGIAVRRK
jgi:hypothetical protein